MEGPTEGYVPQDLFFPGCPLPPVGALEGGGAMNRKHLGAVQGPWAEHGPQQALSWEPPPAQGPPPPTPMAFVPFGGWQAAPSPLGRPSPTRCVLWAQGSGSGLPGLRAQCLPAGRWQRDPPDQVLPQRVKIPSRGQGSRWRCKAAPWGLGPRAQPRTHPADLEECLYLLTSPPGPAWDPALPADVPV